LPRLGHGGGVDCRQITPSGLLAGSVELVDDRASCLGAAEKHLIWKLTKAKK